MMNFIAKCCKMPWVVTKSQVVKEKRTQLCEEVRIPSSHTQLCKKYYSLIFYFFFLL
jgi:hypothetical protein